MTSDEANQEMQTITAAIDDIFLKRKTSLNQRGLYQNTWKLVTQRKAQELYDTVAATIRKHTTRICKGVSQQTDETFLKGLLHVWDDFSRCLRKIKDILLYLDESFVERNSTHEEKKKSVYENGVCIFKEEVLFAVKSRLQRLTLEIILKERENEIIADKFLMKDLTSMMTEIDGDLVYKNIFENEFLRQSHIYYQRESQKYFEASTAVNYLTKVKIRLEEEQERARRCLDKTTLPKIEKVVHEEMIDRYKELVVKKEGSGVLVMLQNQKEDELRLVYEVLGLVEGALDPTIQMLKEYCINEGMATVNDPKKDNNPEELITDMITLRQYYEDLLLHSFSYSNKGHRIRDKNFSKAVREAFDTTVNKNNRFSEYLSLLLDKKLKKGKNQIEDEQSDEFFDKVIMIFRHVQDKDVFERYYKTHLAKRLLSGRSASDDSEKSFLSKLKTSFGYQYTSKLEGMFKDMKVSEDLNSEWNDYQKKIVGGGTAMGQTSTTTQTTTQSTVQFDFDMSVQVLTRVYWPVSKVGTIDMPERQINDAMHVFEQFYVDKHQGRTITWQYNMGTADIRANGFSKQYEFNVSTYQMAILLLFNGEDNTTLTFQQIAEQLKIPPVDLKRNLFTLCMPAEKGKSASKLLLKKFDSDEKKFNKNTMFRANDKFKSQKIKLKILPVVKKEDDDEQKQTKSKIDEERKWVMDAVIVRIMKMRRKMHHRSLILEVTEQLQNRFMPPPDSVKKRIESLIEREYIQREGRSTYLYRA
eukprot:CAMPEP_0117445226 /NCGR_PEP_ID=MMETSP0759-20121206/5679_1 /TAXON_ID=63605 /ORGANISM="Percolomonas cosmopolitus, Strain WS" /LENGTH=754 /DNA_ID=CAMNT_0005237381 /DNA_START=439 /DNA_END=2703 /DNA_ORIENTATION=-